MFDFSGISSALARPGIGGIEGLQRANAVQQMAVAKRGNALPATAAPSQAAKTSGVVQQEAATMVSFAENSIAAISNLSNDTMYLTSRKAIISALRLNVVLLRLKKFVSRIRGSWRLPGRPSMLN